MNKIAKALGKIPWFVWPLVLIGGSIGAVATGSFWAIGIFYGVFVALGAMALAGRFIA